ncbi:hypothetical protein GCM10022240_03110 [Microbacterium kribbense]|uniref:HTH merR-type domain-containing protein n=1 Tax=Microbacterium kribbense TaxID=433645 RepID=A0ABP7G3J4_9MICO
MTQVDPDQGVYGISVAAELVEMGAQTLRQYEARGLLEPDRTAGGTRRYSPNDLDRLRRIAGLLDAGVNLAGIGMVFDLERQNHDLTEQNTRLRAMRGAAMTPDESDTTNHADAAGEADLLDQAADLPGDEDDDYPLGDPDPPQAPG